MIVDLQHKTVIFPFKLHPLIKIIFYLLALLGVYPVLASINSLKRFISTGVPFTKS